MSKATLTLDEARKLYMAAGSHTDHTMSLSEWADIQKDMQHLVDAKSDRAAGKTILWWGCWDRNLTATKFARHVREAYAKSHH